MQGRGTSFPSVAFGIACSAMAALGRSRRFGALLAIIQSHCVVEDAGLERRIESRNETHDKRRFSELAREAFCNQESARALKQRLDDEPEPIIAQSEAPVLQHPSVAALDRPAPLAQSRSGRLATLVDLGRDTEEAAELAMVLGVVALIGEHGPDAGHHGKGGQKQPLEDERVVDIGGRCHTRDRHPVSVYRDILLRAPLDTSCPAWPGPSDWAR